MHISLATLIRRNLVILGTVGSLLLGAATIRAAADWTAVSAPLSDPPTSMQQLKDALAQEQARSAALQEQLDKLASGSSELQAALNAANQRVAVDSETASQLRDQLAAAAEKLAALEKSIARAKAAAAAAAAAPPRAVAASSKGGHDDEEEDEEEDDD